MKAKAETKRKVYEKALKRLKGEGFAVECQPKSLTLKARSPCGRTFVIFPTASRFLELGVKQKPAHLQGGVETFLQHYHSTRAAKRAEEAEWARMRPSLTIFTDAALCPRTGASGWGAWMKGDGPSVSSGGQIAELLRSSTEAEIRAGANAFAFARSRGILKPQTCVIWQSDSLHSLRWLVNSYPMARDRPAKDGGLSVGPPGKVSPVALQSRGLEELVKICRAMRLVVLVRHVRGHQEGPNRQWVNRHCDEIAGEHMRARRLEAPNYQPMTYATERAEP